MPDRDEYFMRLALLQAEQAFNEREVPVGAVAVIGDEVIARAHNETERLQDPSAHAELLCLRRAAGVLKNRRLLQVTLYTTLEPCVVCMGSAFAFRIERLVWGAPDIRLGADGSWISLTKTPHPMHSFPTRGGVLAEEAGAIMKEFFRKRRVENNERDLYGIGVGAEKAAICHSFGNYPPDYRRGSLAAE